MKTALKITLFSIIISSCQLFVPKPQSERFYCKIDGKSFRPDNGGDVFFEPLLAQYNENSNVFYISVHTKDETSINIGTKFKNFKDFREKKYLVSEEFNATYFGKYIEINGNTTVNERFETYLNSGYIEFTKIDTLKQIVSGVFEFKVKSVETDKIINIKNGQFNDVFYY